MEFQIDLTAEEYADLMNDNIEDLTRENQRESQAKGVPSQRFGMGRHGTIGNQGCSLQKMVSKLAWAL
jgi:hypothetical protein